MINENIETVKNLLTTIQEGLIDGKNLSYILYYMQSIEDELKIIYENYEEEINVSFAEGFLEGLKEGEEMYDEGRVI